VGDGLVKELPSAHTFLMPPGEGLPQPCVVQMGMGRSGQGFGTGLRHRAGVIPKSLRGLHVHIHAAVALARIEVPHQRIQRRGFARLAWGMQHEVAFLVNQVLQLIEVHTLEGV